MENKEEKLANYVHLTALQWKVIRIDGMLSYLLYIKFTEYSYMTAFASPVHSRQESQQPHAR